MRRRISLVVLTNSGAPARQFCASRNALRAMLAAAAVLLCLSAWAAWDYARLKRSALLSGERERELIERLSAREREIELQRALIGDFAGEINRLKERIVGLHEFEKKIRLMADLDRRPDAGQLFGVGGAVPRDLDPRIALGEGKSSLLREMKTQVEQLAAATAGQQAGFQEVITHLEQKRSVLAATPTIRPVDPFAEQFVSSRFEHRINPFTNLREFHRGIDISAREGTPIHATAAGVVTFAGVKGLLGKAIVIDHGHGLTTTYGHCSRLLKKAGDRVNRWDVIALIGNTGTSTGPHVHYEVALHGVPVNPERYFLN